MKSLLLLAAFLAFAGLWLKANSDDIPYPASYSKPEELTQYKAETHKIIGSHWYPGIDQNYKAIEPGRVRIRYTIHSDGSLTDVTVIEGKNLPLLTKISMDALTSSAPFKPFDDALRKQVGEKFTDDSTFSITGSAK